MAGSRSKKGPGGARGQGGQDDVAPSPWLAGVYGVTGVVPPGRRLSPPTERRPNAWSASGVQGVTPPGKQKPGEGPADVAKDKAARRRGVAQKADARAFQNARSGRPPPKRRAASDPGAEAEAARPKAGRPQAGFVPNPFAGLRDPPDLKTYLDAIAELMRELPLGPDSIEGLGELIRQSHAPYEIAVGFTMLSVAVGRSNSMKRRYALVLERGAKVFFNLSRRLNPTMSIPRGLAPQTVDPIFYDLPTSAYEIPFAFATSAFCRVIELVREDEATDRKLVTFAQDLRKRYIDGRSHGDERLERMFPWTPPAWAPDDDSPPL